MKERQRRSIIVGIFVLVGIFLFIFAIYLIGKKEYVFGQPTEVCAIFTDVKGLKEGDKVRMSGIDVGKVQSMTIIDNNRVFVLMNIDKEQFFHINQGSRVLLGSQGLMGAKVVNILPGEVQGVPISEGDTLGTLEEVEINDIVRQLSGATANITIVSEELVTIAQKINRGEGIFGKLLSDSSMNKNLDQTMLNLEQLTTNFNSISRKINQGGAVESINVAAANLKEITDKINSGEGALGQLLSDTSLVNTLVYSSKNLQSTTANLMDLTAALNNDSSALNLLIKDPSFADSLEVTISRLNTGLIEVTEAAEAVQRSGIVRIGGKKKRK